MYVDEASKQEMYAEFEQWLNEYGMNVKMGKRVNKTLHSVLARWRFTEDRGLEHNNDNKESHEENEENEDKGYNSDIGYDVLSKRWSREETKMQDQDDDKNYDDDEIESEQEKESISMEMNDRSGCRNRVGKGEQSVGIVGSPAKGTRSHMARDYDRRVRK